MLFARWMSSCPARSAALPAWPVRSWANVGWHTNVIAARTGAAGVLLAGRQRVGDAKRLAIGDVARIHVDRVHEVGAVGRDQVSLEGVDGALAEFESGFGARWRDEVIWLNSRDVF